MVTHANGVDFLMKDAKDRNGNPYEVAVQELVARGVKFEVCEITLKNRSLQARSSSSRRPTSRPRAWCALAKLQQRGRAPTSSPERPTRPR